MKKIENNIRYAGIDFANDKDRTVIVCDVYVPTEEEVKNLLPFSEDIIINNMWEQYYRNLDGLIIKEAIKEGKNGKTTGV